MGGCYQCLPELRWNEPTNEGNPNGALECSADSRLIWQGAAPCGPFRSLVCALWPFSASYMRPAALFDAFICAQRPFPILFICAWRLFLFASLRPSVHVYL